MKHIIPFSLITLFALASCQPASPDSGNATAPAAAQTAATPSCAFENKFSLDVQVESSDSDDLRESGEKGAVHLTMDPFEVVESSFEFKGDKAAVLRMYNYAESSRSGKRSEGQVEIVIRLDVADGEKISAGEYTFGDFRNPRRASLVMITAGHMVEAPYTNGEPSYGTLSIESADIGNFCARANMYFEKNEYGSISLKGDISLAPKGT